MWRPAGNAQINMPNTRHCGFVVRCRNHSYGGFRRNRFLADIQTAQKKMYRTRPKPWEVLIGTWDWDHMGKCLKTNGHKQRADRRNPRKTRTRTLHDDRTLQIRDAIYPVPNIEWVADTCTNPTVSDQCILPGNCVFLSRKLHLACFSCSLRHCFFIDSLIDGSVPYIHIGEIHWKLHAATKYQHSRFCKFVAMRMSCNGCRVLRKGCSDSCTIRPCLQWIKSAESQANATVFLAKFYGRAGLMSLINAAVFRSLLYEACGRIVNPVYGSVGLLWSGNWQICQAAVESILKGCPIHPISQESAEIQNPSEHSAKITAPHSTLMDTIAHELHKVKIKGRFKCTSQAKKLSKSNINALNSCEGEDLTASQVCNLRYRRCYPGGEIEGMMKEPPNNLVSSDSSSESEHCGDDLKNNIKNENSFMGDLYAIKENNSRSNPIEKESNETLSHATDMQSPKFDFEAFLSDDDNKVGLELTLGSQGSGTANPASEKISYNRHGSGCMEQPVIITSLGLGLTPS
eukprot:Gb_36943 [translate_table: standard]